MSLYWYLVLPHLHDYLGVGTVVLFIVCCFGIFMSCCTNDDFEEEDSNFIFSLSTKGLIVCACIGLLCCFIPTQKDLAIMFGWDAINSNTVAEVVELLKEKLK